MTHRYVGRLWRPTDASLNCGMRSSALGMRLNFFFPTLTAFLRRLRLRCYNAPSGGLANPLYSATAAFSIALSEMKHSGSEKSAPPGSLLSFGGYWSIRLPLAVRYRGFSLL